MAITISPTNIEGFPTDTTVRLKWSVTVGATGYKIKYGTTTNVYTTTTDVGNVLEKTLTGLTAETKYYITVCAYDTDGDGPYSFEITRTPTSIIDYPNFRTTSLIGYLPSDYIIGNMPFKVPETQQGTEEFLDFDYEIEIGEDPVEYSETITKGSGDYDALTKSNIIEVSMVRDEYGTIYEYLTDYYMLWDRIYWTWVAELTAADGIVTGGINLASATGGFTIDMVGKVILLSGTPYTKNTVATFVDTNNITLGTSVTNATYTYVVGSTDIPVATSDYTITYKYLDTTTQYFSKYLTGLSGSVEQKIRTLSFTDIENTTKYLKMYDDPTTSTVKLDVFKTLGDMTVGVPQYAYADIETGYGYYSLFTDNLMKDNNPSFEEATLLNWTSAGTITNALSTTYFKYGTQALRQNGPCAGGGVDYAQSDYVTIEGSSYYTFSGYVKNTATLSTGAYIRLKEYDVSNVLLATSTTTPITAICDWTRQFATIFSNVNTVKVKIELVVDDATGCNLYWDGVQLEQNNYLTPYTDTVGDNVLITADIVRLFPGTVSNSAGGTTVTGLGTYFLTTFNVGDTITIPATTGQTVVISAITSDTVMTTETIIAANSNVVYDVETPIIGSVGIKYLPLTPVIINKYEYNPYPTLMVGYQNGNAVKSFELDMGAREEKIDRVVYFRTRVMGNYFQTNWSETNTLNIAMSYILETTERDFGSLPDEHIYDKDQLKLDPVDRTNKVYNIQLTYGTEFDVAYYKLNRTRSDKFLDTVNDKDFDPNFGSQFDSQRPADLEWSEYRYIVKQMNIASTEGSTIAAVNRLGNAFTGVDPNILLIRDYDWWILNGNLIHNPSFELNGAPLGALSFWTLPANVVSTQSTEQYTYNNYSMKQIAGVVGPANYETVSDYMPVDATQDYTLSAHYYCPSTNGVDPIFIKIYYYDDAGNNLGNDGYYPTSAPEQDYWYRISKTFTHGTFPSGTVKAKVVLGMTATLNEYVYWDAIQFEQGNLTPYENFEYYLDDPVYPEIEPPTLWDKNEMAYSFVLQIRNPYGFELNQDYIETTIMKFVPAHVKIYLQFLTVGESLGYMTWDEGLTGWDVGLWGY